MERAAEIVTPGRGGVRSGYPLTLPALPRARAARGGEEKNRAEGHVWINLDISA